jgi:hypothetical protein
MARSLPRLKGRNRLVDLAERAYYYIFSSKGPAHGIRQGLQDRTTLDWDRPRSGR